jgi:sugar phosphate isomerase/epimerase
MSSIKRREFVKSGLGLAFACAWQPASICRAGPEKVAGEPPMRFGLVTYMWGHDWNLPTLLANCEKAGALGVELRTGHAHGVEPSLSQADRSEVKKRFADSPVTLVGLGSNEDFHDVDPTALQASLERAKAFVKLSHDVGGSGVKVKPNDLPAGVPHKKTIEQIGNALNELGAYAAEYGQQIRLEVHGQCAPLPTIAAIMALASRPQVAVCWNSNPQDLDGEGLDHNFHLVKSRLGSTTHVRKLDDSAYPAGRLIQLLKDADYRGWLLLEDSDRPADRVLALTRQREAFDLLLRQSS